VALLLANDFKGNVNPAGQTGKYREIGCDLSDGIDLHGQIGPVRLRVEDRRRVVAGAVSNITIIKVELPRALNNVYPLSFSRLNRR